MSDGVRNMEREKTRGLLRDAYGACADTADALGATEVANLLRRFAFQIEWKAEPGATTWIFPRAEKKAGVSETCNTGIASHKGLP